MFGITAVDRAPKTTHQRRDLRADGKLAARAGFHDDNALDANDWRGLSPLASTHVLFGMVDPKCFDLDDGMAGLGPGSGTSL
jgi:hypothetical protein